MKIYNSMSRKKEEFVPLNTYDLNFSSNKDDKDRIDKFIQQVDSTNKEYKKMQKLSITLNDVENELKENREKV